MVAMTLPTNTIFAEEVKSDRLKALYRITAVVSFVLILGLLTFGTLSNLDAGTTILWLVSAIVLLAGSFVTAQIVQRMTFRLAAWTYILCAIVGIALLLYKPAPMTLQITPFVFPIIIFIGGLLLSPLSALGLTAICSVVVVAVPLIGTETTSWLTT